MRCPPQAMSAYISAKKLAASADPTIGIPDLLRPVTGAARDNHRYCLSNTAHYSTSPLLNPLFYLTAELKAAAAGETVAGKDPLQENIYAQVRVGPNTELYIAPFDRAAIMPIEQICDSRRVQLPAEKTLSIARYVSKNSAVPYGMCVAFRSMRPCL